MSNAIHLELASSAASCIEDGSLEWQLIRAREELEEVEKARTVLQDTVDALSAMPDLDQFMAVALRITAQAFQATTCSYFEHRGDDPIQLKFTYMDGDVLSQEQVLQLGDEFAFLKKIAVGFDVPDSYFGEPFRKRTRTCVVDHAKADPPTPISRHSCQVGRPLELNVPLLVGGKPEGALVIKRGYGEHFSASEITLAERLAQQLALAMVVSRLSAEAKQATVAREQEMAANIRVEEVEKAGQAVRETVDVLANMPDLEQFIPATLQIIARAFHSRHCSYFENRDNGQARLTYWFLEDRVLSREDIFKLPPEYDFMKFMATGITIKDSYFGVPFQDRMKATVIDRSHADRDSDIDVYARSRGWYLELNVPLLVAGRTVGEVVIQRNAGESYTEAEVALGERLGQQLAVAMEVSRLSAEEKQTTILRERELAALGRADEMAQYSEALRRTLDSLVDESDLSRFTEKLLLIISEQLQAPVVEYWSVDEDDIVRLERTCRDGTIYESSDREDDVRTRGLRIPSQIINAPTVGEMTTYYIVEDLEDSSIQRPLFDGLDFNLKQWCEERGVRRMLNLPLVRGGRCFAALLAYLPDEKRFDQPKIDVAYSFAQQLGLSIRLRELAEESKQAAVLREREAATQRRAAEFAKANAVLSSTLDRLAEERDLRTFPRAILKEAISQTGGQDGIILLYELGTDVLQTTEVVLSASSTEEDAELLSVPFWKDFQTEKLKATEANAEPRVIDLELYADTFPEETRAWHKNRRHKYLVSVPMVLNSQPFGYFGVAFSQPADEVSKVSLGLIQALAQQATLAIQLTRLAESSQQAALSLERQHVIIQEREHLSREIHDRLTQGYAAILMQQHAMRRSMKVAPEKMNEHLEIIERLSRENLAEARKTMDELRVDPLGPIDLQRALQTCVEQFHGRYAMEISLNIEDELPMVPHYLEIEVCRILGEAVTNACKHSRARSVNVKAQYSNERISLLIQDDGIGFDAQVKATSFGIASMYERAARAGAELTLTSAPGCGTQVMLALGLR